MSELFTQRGEYKVSDWGMTCTVFGEAKPGGSKRIGRVGGKKDGRPIVLDDNRHVAEWKSVVEKVVATLMQGRDPFAGPLMLAVTFYQQRPKSHYNGKLTALHPRAPKYPTGKPDATKLLRPLEDAMTGIVYKDDAQIVEQIVRKRYVPLNDPPKVDIQVGVLA